MACAQQASTWAASAVHSARGTAPRRKTAPSSRSAAEAAAASRGEDPAATGAGGAPKAKKSR